MNYEWNLTANDELELTQILNMSDSIETVIEPASNGVKEALGYFYAKGYGDVRNKRKVYYDDLVAKSNISTGDVDFDCYIN